MTTATSGLPLTPDTLARRARLRDTLAAYAELSKARLSSLVLMTTGAGFLLAQQGAVDWARLVLTLLGSALAAFGVNALNQRIEIERDRRMPRTCRRPLPLGLISPRAATAFGLTLSLAGPILLAAGVNWPSAVLTLLCEVVYLAAYTPLKLRTPLNTLVGAICGALPPMIGWAAVTGGLDWPAWSLGAILFIWQIPHFLALAWLYRDDYLRGGFRMLSADDSDGGRTASVALLYSALLVPVSLTLVLGGATGALYGFAALLLGGWLLWVNIRFCRQPSPGSARRLFLASVIYLPLLLIMMIVDRT